MGLRDRLREDPERRKEEFAKKKEDYSEKKGQRKGGPQGDAEDAADENRSAWSTFKEGVAEANETFAKGMKDIKEDLSAEADATREELGGRLDESRARREATKPRSGDTVDEARDKGARRMAQTAGVDTTGAIMTMMSKEDGRNAVVALYPDRLERTKPRSAASLSKSPQDREVIPVSRVSHVRVEKDGATKVAVHVTVSGEEVVFRVSRAEGERFRDELMKLVLGTSASTPPPAASPADDPTEQLRKFAALRDDGVISEEDFQAKKQQILGL